MPGWSLFGALKLQGDLVMLPLPPSSPAPSPAVEHTKLAKHLLLHFSEYKKLLVWNAKSQLIGKDPDAGKDRGQEKGTAEDEMAGWRH